MRLKKLIISGFKSFANRVAIDFDCGIIGIVGPNGCGKSNIVDAFRWVMGEQSAKSMRGEKMHDVLFAGTDHRKPLNYAEVSVILSEVSNDLPVPYDEVCISRKLYRSGESEYFINKEIVRLKDIQNLFLGSGIGRNAFSIFEQGKLDQIIYLNPLDRRIIFDEAAGTSRFLQRKKETVRKLSSISENYVRVLDIHSEIEKQTKQLRKQAGQAKIFQENKARLEYLEKGILIHKWKGLDEKNRNLDEKRKKLNLAWQEAQGHVAALDEALKNTRQAASEAEQGVQELQKELHSTETKSRLLESSINQNKSRLFENKKREENLKNHLKELEGEKEKNKIQIVGCGNEAQQAALKKDQLHQAVRQKKEAVQQQENALNLLKTGLKKLQAEHLKRVQEHGRVVAELHAKKVRYETIQARLLVLEKKVHEEIQEIPLIEKEADMQKEKVASLSEQIDLLKDEIVSSEKELFHLREEIKTIEGKEQPCLKELNEAEGQLKALTRLQQDLEGFSVGAKALIKESQNRKSPLYKKIRLLAEYLIPKKGFETVIANAMRPYSETLVVETEEDLKLLREHAEKKKISDFSVIIKKEISAAKKYHQNSLAAFVETNDLAVHCTQHFVLDRESSYFDLLGIFFHAASGKKTNHIFLRHAELKSLGSLISELQDRLKEYAASKEELTAKLKEAENKRNEISEARRKKEMDLIQENFRLQQVAGKLERMRADISSLQTEFEDLKQAQKNEAQFLEHEQIAKKIEEEIFCLSTSIKEDEAHVEQKEGALRQGQKFFMQAEEKAQNAMQECSRLRQQIEIIEIKLHQSSLHEKKINQEIEELEASSNTIIQKIAREEKEFEWALELVKSTTVNLKEKDKKVTEIKKRHEIQEKELFSKRKSVLQLEKEKHVVETSLSHEFSQIQEIEGELFQRYSLPSLEIGVIEDILSEGTEEALKEMQHLRVSLESSGAINMAAIEEFQATQERFDYFDRQLKDLEESKKDLEMMIAKLEQESRKVFKKTFSLIRENFQKNFSILFNGGLADLTFTDSSDILEAGIDIVAKPPGKHMRAISLLSGGEKCLTALALLFAIFEVRPAPFCILDEVDAPLDDSNIERFTAVLKQFIDKTQFVIVTHNKKTMAIADLLIGVSMEEKGVSKLISLAFEKSPAQRI
jgi:chromosome segregation protein